jgi:hypothetical protein
MEPSEYTRFQIFTFHTLILPLKRTRGFFYCYFLDLDSHPRSFNFPPLSVFGAQRNQRCESATASLRSWILYRTRNPDLDPDTNPEKMKITHPPSREKTLKSHAFMSWQLSLEGWRLPWSVKNLNGGLSKNLLFFFWKKIRIIVQLPNFLKFKIATLDSEPE